MGSNQLGTESQSLRYIFSLMPAAQLPVAFFQRPDVLAIARELLGKHL